MKRVIRAAKSFGESLSTSLATALTSLTLFVILLLAISALGFISIFHPNGPLRFWITNRMRKRKQRLRQRKEQDLM